MVRTKKMPYIQHRGHSTDSAKIYVIFKYTQIVWPSAKEHWIMFNVVMCTCTVKCINLLSCASQSLLALPPELIYDGITSVEIMYTF